VSGFKNIDELAETHKKIAASRQSVPRLCSANAEVMRLLNRILRNDSEITEDAARSLSLTWIARAAAKLKHRIETQNGKDEAHDAND